MNTELKQKDPVCGKDVSVTRGPIEAEFEGNDYYFCSEACRRNFLEDPSRFLEKWGLAGMELAGL